MPDEYFTVVTDAGTRKILEAVSEEKKINIITFGVGDGAGKYYMPTTDMTALKNEVWRGEVNACYISEQSENLIIVESFIPAEVGGFTIREMGLFDADGALIAICNTPDTQKVRISDGAVHELDLSMEIALSNADHVELVVDPSAVTASKRDIRELRAEQEESISALTRQIEDTKQFIAGATVKRDITIPTKGWDIGAQEVPKALYLDIPQSDITEEMVPIVNILPDCISTAKACGLSTAVRSMDGALRLYTQKIPDAEIRASLILLLASNGAAAGGSSGGSYILPAATANRLGGVKIGDGVNVEEDGKISVDGASILNEAATTEGAVEEMLDEVFGSSREDTGSN